MTLNLPAEWSIDERANWFRAYLRSEIQRVLRERAASGTKWTVTVVCTKCGTPYEISRRRANGANVCKGCWSSPEPDERHRRWVARIPEERRGDLLAAVELLA